MKATRTISKAILATTFACIALAGFCDKTTVWRDAQGRNMGTITTDSSGKKIYRDSMGRMQGTATTDNYGRTTYRDSMGRIKGTKK